MTAKVLITRSRVQAADFAERLREAGFEPVFFPVIEIEEIENNPGLDKAIEAIQKYDWVVFTSVNAVNIVLKLSVPSAFSVVKIAAVGPKTADALSKYNLKPDFIPDEYVGEAILSGLGDIKDKWILLPRAEIARQDLPVAIVKAGGVAHEVTVYKTLPAEVDVDGLAALRSGVDVVTFTSPSTVENFIAVVRNNGLDPFNLPNNPVFACIGRITGKAAKESGFENVIIAAEHTIEGLTEAIKNNARADMEKS